VLLIHQMEGINVWFAYTPVLSAILFIFGPNIYIFCELALVKSTQITFIKTQIALFKAIIVLRLTADDNLITRRGVKYQWD
jgi:hypothetical protein